MQAVPAPWTSLLSKENAVLFKHQLLFIYPCTAKTRRSVSPRLCAARQSERRRGEVMSFRWELEDQIALWSFTDKLFLMIGIG